MRIFRLQNANNQLYQTNTETNYKFPEYELEYDYSHMLADGSERRQHPDADTGTDLQKAMYDNTIYRGSDYIF